MSLLQRSMTLTGRPTAPIYIPQCLYYNQRNHLDDRIGHLIYIPQCLYYNRIKSMLSHAQTRFTFHNVSITTQISNDLRVRRIYLHSTMSLLQQEELNIDITAKEIYIPQCLYYNHMMTKAEWAAIMLIYIPQCLYYNALLIKDFFSAKGIYIPQCLYYNERLCSYSSG